MRTRLLWASAVVAVVLAALPSAAFADSGTPKYGYVAQWDSGVKWLEDVTVDKFGNVYASGQNLNQVRKFSSTGAYLGSIGTTGSGDGQFDGPGAVVTDRWGRLFVGDRQNSAPPQVNVQVFDGQGNFLTKLTGSTAGSLSDLSITPEGYLYQVDDLQNVRRWDPLGAYVGSWSTLSAATGVGIDHDGNVYTGSREPVLGLQGHRIDRYSAAGFPISSWGSLGTGAGQFDLPEFLRFDPFGQLIVSEYGNQRLQVFSGYGGTSLGMLTGPASDPFASPRGLDPGFSRDLYVADSSTELVYRLETTQATVYSELAGSGRIETAVQASKKAYPNGAGTVLIATGYNFPDALGGAALAGAKKAPLLLTYTDSLPATVAAEITRLGATKAIILGGTAAVGTDVETALNGQLGDANVDRIGGANRYETAEGIAAAAVAAKGAAYDRVAFVATGLDFPDALSASPIAAANGWPIYLVGPTLTNATKAAMQAAGVSTVYILGSNNAVPDAVEKALNTAFGDANVSRLQGPGRYETAAAIADFGFAHGGMYWSHLAIATGENYPDALAGGVLQGSDYSVMLLSRKGSLPAATAAAIEAHKKQIYGVRWLGSTSALGTTPRADIAGRLF